MACPSVSGRLLVRHHPQNQLFRDGHHIGWSGGLGQFIALSVDRGSWPQADDILTHGFESICREPAENEFSDLCYTFEYRCQNGTRPALDMGLTKGRLEVEQVEWWKRELPMSDQDVAMRIAVASAFRDCGLPSNEQDVDDFLVALRSFGYVVKRLDHRTTDE
jgi:hypothetical protein